MTSATAIIPNWNRRELLVGLLERLPEQTRRFAETIVVDNASQDGSPEAAARHGARVIRLETNRGFAAAVNRGIEASRTGYVAVINNDVELEPDWLERLAHVLDADPSRWFATGKILLSGDRGTLDGAYDLISRGGCAWRAGHGRKDSPAWSGSRPIRAAPLTAALLRTALFDRVGLLDEGFESYLEDVDFGLRCACAGYEGMFVAEARAYHRGSATLGRWHPDTVRRIARNQLLLVAKHYPDGWLARFGWPVLAGQALWCALAFRHGAGWAGVRGKIEGLRRFRTVRRENAELRLRAAVPAAAVIEASETEIRRLQEAGGPDWYWRMYFGLT